MAIYRQSAEKKQSKSTVAQGTTAMSNPKPKRSEHFYQVSESAKAALWPKHNAGLGLYMSLVGLVTVEVPDPRNGSRKIGVVLRGSQLTDADLAKRIGCDLRKLRYEKGVLFDEGLLIQRRYQGNYRLAIRCSAKNCHQASLDDPKYRWLKEALAKPQKRRRCTQNDVEPDSKSNVERDPRDVECDSGDVERDSLLALDQQNHEDSLPDKIVDKRGDERERPQTKTPTSPSSESQNPEVKIVTDDLVRATCSKLYGLGAARNPCQPTFSAKYRAGIADLLAKYHQDELEEAYERFIRNLDGFQMRNSPKFFCEGGAEDVIAFIRQKKREAEKIRATQLAEKRREQEKQETEARLREAEDELLAEQDEGSTDPDAIERRKLRGIVNADNKEPGWLHALSAFVELRRKAVQSPEFQAALQARLAEDSAKHSVAAPRVGEPAAPPAAPEVDVKRQPAEAKLKPTLSGKTANPFSKELRERELAKLAAWQAAHGQVGTA
jgi:hypothetical protein